MLLTLLKGFTTGAGLIVAIGAQNAFVIRQGLLRNHLFLTAIFCSVVDAFLILLGVFGFGTVIAHYPLSIQIAKYFAIVFLLLYGLLSMKSACNPRALTDANQQKSSKKNTILLLLALSFLNPHVYLDTVVLLGSIAVQQLGLLRFYFALGAILASFFWFFALTYGSHFLAPFLHKPKVWKWIDILIALTMWAIALTLLNCMQT